MKKQSGISTIALLAILGVAIVFITIGVRVGPLYMDNISLNQAIETSARSGASFHSMSKSEIRSKLQKTFGVNNINVDHKAIKIVKGDRFTTLTYEHEERVNLFKNVDVVVSFVNYYSTEDD